MPGTRPARTLDKVSSVWLVFSLGQGFSGVWCCVGFGDSSLMRSSVFCLCLLLARCLWVLYWSLGCGGLFVGCLRNLIGGVSLVCVTCFVGCLRDLMEIA